MAYQQRQQQHGLPPLYSSRVRASMMRPSWLGSLSDASSSRISLSNCSESVGFRTTSRPSTSASKEGFHDMSLSRHYLDQSSQADVYEEDFEGDAVRRRQSTSTSIGDFWTTRILIFRSNLESMGDILHGSNKQEEEKEKQEECTSTCTGREEGPFSTFRRNVSVISKRLSFGRDNDSSALATFRRNMDAIAKTISRSGTDTHIDNEMEDSGRLSVFVKARVDTFSKNVNFAQTAAEHMTRDLGRLDTFSKNVNFAQATAESITRDLGTLDTFSKNIDYAQAQVESLAFDLGTSLRGGGNPQENSQTNAAIVFC